VSISQKAALIFALEILALSLHIALIVISGGLREQAK